METTVGFIHYKAKRGQQWKGGHGAGPLQLTDDGNHRQSWPFESCRFSKRPDDCKALQRQQARGLVSCHLDYLPDVLHCSTILSDLSFRLLIAWQNRTGCGDTCLLAAKSTSRLPPPVGQSADNRARRLSDAVSASGSRVTEHKITGVFCLEDPAPNTMAAQRRVAALTRQLTSAPAELEGFDAVSTVTDVVGSTESGFDPRSLYEWVFTFHRADVYLHAFCASPCQNFHRMLPQRH